MRDPDFGRKTDKKKSSARGLTKKSLLSLSSIKRNLGLSAVAASASFFSFTPLSPLVPLFREGSVFTFVFFFLTSAPGTKPLLYIRKGVEEGERKKEKERIQGTNQNLRLEKKEKREGEGEE